MNANAQRTRRELTLSARTFPSPSLSPFLELTKRDTMSWRARFTPNLSYVMCTLNPKDPNCFGLRSWLRNNLTEIQMLNPALVFHVHETTFGEPNMTLDFTSLDQRVVRLAGVTESELDEIFEASIAYSANHVVIERGRADDGGEPTLSQLINNFSYTDSFISKMEVFPPGDRGQHQTFGVDDPGQRPKVLPRNSGVKITP